MTRGGMQPWKGGPWDRAAAAHLLRRAGFGASRAEQQRALDEGFESTLARCFEPAGHDPQLVAGIESLLAAGDLAALQGWWMALILAGGDPLRERAVLMWHDHFATSDAKVGDVRLMHRQNRLMRERGLGDFRALLHELARDPAMLLWLDGNENERGHPNENFAREVLELFALGIGNYSESDIQEAARAFTGWGTEGREFVVRAREHDAGPKTIFGKSTTFDGDAAIDWILAQPACPRHVARRTLRAFVSVDPEPADVEALARELVAADWSIDKALEVLLSSELFFSPGARRSRIAAPVEHVAGSLRTTDARMAPNAAARAAARMGQSLFRPPSVKGWDGGRAWINAGSWIERTNFVLELARALAGEGGTIRAEVPATVDRAQVARDTVELLLGASPDRDYESAVGAAAARAASDREALAAAAAVVMTSAEYQLV